MAHSTPIEIRFADIDVMGHVNNAIYLNYFEQARMQFFKDLIGGNWDWVKSGILLARNEIDYKLPVKLHDNIVVKTTCDHIGTKSVTLAFAVVRKETTDNVICAQGKCVMVCFDYTTQQTIAVPDLWREKFATIMGA